MFQIEQVVAEATKHFIQGIGIAVVQGGVRGYSGTNLIQITVAGIFFYDLVDIELAFGTGAYESHVSTEDVPELGEFVQMVVAQESADFCHTGVFLTGIEGGAFLLGIQLHAAEFIDIERAAEATDTLLLENGRATVFTLHGNIA